MSRNRSSGRGHPFGICHARCAWRKRLGSGPRNSTSGQESSAALRNWRPAVRIGWPMARAGLLLGNGPVRVCHGCVIQRGQGLGGALSPSGGACPGVLFGGGRVEVPRPQAERKLCRRGADPCRTGSGARWQAFRGSACQARDEVQSSEDVQQDCLGVAHRDGAQRPDGVPRAALAEEPAGLDLAAVAQGGGLAVALCRGEPLGQRPLLGGLGGRRQRPGDARADRPADQAGALPGRRQACPATSESRRSGVVQGSAARRTSLAWLPQPGSGPSALSPESIRPRRASPPLWTSDALDPVVARPPSGSEDSRFAPLPRDAVRRAPHDDSHICPPSLLAQGTSRNGLSFGDYYLRAERAYAGARNYDSQPNVTQMTDPAGYSATYAYDLDNHL